MILFQTKEKDKIVLKELSEHPEAIVVESDFVSGDAFFEILIPLTAIITPAVTQIAQKIIRDKRVTLKKGGIEISAEDYETAIKLYKELNNIKED